MPQKTTIEEQEQKIERLQAEVNALEALRDEIKECDAIADTELSEWFHEIRTSSDYWNSATAFINIDTETETATLENVDKLSQGRFPPEYKDSFDVTLSARTKPFQRTKAFRRIALKQLKERIRIRKDNIRGSEHRIEMMEKDSIITQ